MDTKTKLQLGLSTIALLFLASNCLASSDIPLNGGVLQPGESLKIRLDELMSGYYYVVKCLIRNVNYPNERVYFEYTVGNPQPGDINTSKTTYSDPGFLKGWPNIRRVHQYIQIKSLDYSDPVAVSNCRAEFTGNPA